MLYDSKRKKEICIVPKFVKILILLLPVQTINPNIDSVTSMALDETGTFLYYNQYTGGHAKSFRDFRNAYMIFSCRLAGMLLERLFRRGRRRMMFVPSQNFST